MAFDMHSSLVLKSYPRNQTHIEMKMPEPGPLLAQARAGAAGTTFIQRLNDLAAEHKEMRSQTQHQQKVAALWSTMQQLSFDSKDLSAANPLAGSKMMADSYKRSAKFTSTFQEPGGAYRMYQDSSLGSFKRLERLKAMHEEKRAKILGERQARIQEMIKAKEAKLLARRSEREGRRHAADARQHAATKIQATFRGGYARRHIAMYKEHRRQYSAYRIQHSYRMHLDRKPAVAEVERRRRLRRDERAAKVMQKAGRNYVGRKQAAPLLERRRKELEMEHAMLQEQLDNEAAAHIQAIYRGQKGRERAAEIKAQQRKDAVLRAQEERLQAKVEEELRLAGAGAGARNLKSPEIGRPFGLTAGVPRSPSPGAPSRTPTPSRPGSRSKK